MEPISFQLASEIDDQKLRDLVASIYMEGSMSLVFKREPYYFTGENIGSLRTDTMICKRGDKIIGTASRSLRTLYINGKPETIWYLSMLRLIPEMRSHLVLGRGYRFFSRLTNDSTTPYFITTILDENTHARKVLESGRGGLPYYNRVGTFKTYFIPLSAKYSRNKENDKIHHANAFNFESTAECLSDWGQKHDFAPVYTTDNLALENDFLLPMFNSKNLYVYEEDSKVVATLGIWDQSTFKQTTVHSYSSKMKVSRLFYNMGSYLTNIYPSLPKEGERIKILYACMISSKDKNSFEQLLQRVRCDWSGLGYDWLAVGIASQSELESEVLKHSLRSVSSGIYLVSWEKENFSFPKGELHLELATL